MLTQEKNQFEDIIDKGDQSQDIWMLEWVWVKV